ncbi:DUF6894 family protein [uncultured Methylobacterium sp.]|uniref:DUF6894 family protein n=1 Tax=uncultured Methylobacterium sp. TaxID=157278 RepID=UPI0035CA0C05
MARYYFDIHDGQVLIRDTQGSECIDDDAVRQEAMGTLPAIARDVIPTDGDKQAFTVLVRDENNMTVYMATLTFAGLWMGDMPIPEHEPAD